MAKATYPLKQVLEVKEKRVEDAEKVVLEKRLALKREEEKLEERKRARDEVKKHEEAKLQQLRDEMDHGTTCPKILQMRAYLKVVKERLKTEDKKVEDQKGEVKKAEDALKSALLELAKKRLEVDKLLTHQKDWLKEVGKEEEILEGREQDEIGSLTYLANRRKNK